MSGKQTAKKGGSVLGKRPAPSSASSRVNTDGPRKPVPSNPPRPLKRHSAERKEQQRSDDEEGGDGGDSSDSDDADIAIDINAKQQHSRATQHNKHRPATTTAPSTAASHASTAQSVPDADIISVDFGLFDPLPDDDFTFRLLLKDYVPDHVALPVPVRLSTTAAAGKAGAGVGTFALHELCALISHQVEVGTTIKADGTDEPLGFITALPLPPLQHAPQPLYQLHSYLSAHVPTAYKARLNALFSSSSHNVLIVQSRMLNTPTALVGPLHHALVEDVAWAASTTTTASSTSTAASSHNTDIPNQLTPSSAPSPAPSTNPAWRLDRALLLGRCVKAGSGISGGKRSGGGGGGGGLDVWQRFEEEWYERESEWSCRWTVPHRAGGAAEDGGGSEAEERREGAVAVLMCLTWDAVKRVAEHIELMMKDA